LLDFAEHKRARQQTGRLALVGYLAAFGWFAKSFDNKRFDQDRSADNWWRAR
jgi:hypothetical protein